MVHVHLYRFFDVVTCFAKAVHREEAAKELRDEAQKLIQRMQRSAEEATLKSDKSMKERVNENQHVTWLYFCQFFACLAR